MIVSIEGLDASGKDLQCSLLIKKIEAELIKFPDYSTTIGRVILDFLNNENLMDERNAWTFQGLQFINRAEWATKINDLKLQNKNIVFNRYSLSSVAYGQSSGVDADWIKNINKLLPQPDVTFYLDITVEESLKRRPNRRDSYELNTIFLEKVRQSYLTLCDSGMAVYINGMQSPEAVHNEILNQIGKLKNEG